MQEGESCPEQQTLALFNTGPANSKGYPKLIKAQPFKDLLSKTKMVVLCICLFLVHREMRFCPILTQQMMLITKTLVKPDLTLIINKSRILIRTKIISFMYQITMVKENPQKIKLILVLIMAVIMIKSVTIIGASHIIK